MKGIPHVQNLINGKKNIIDCLGLNFQARFYFHQFGKNAGSLNFSMVEIREKENFTSTLWWNSRDLGQEWHRIEIIMPNITSK